VVSGLTRFPDHLHWVIQTYRNQVENEPLHDNFIFTFFSMNQWAELVVDQTLPINITHIDYSSKKYRCYSRSNTLEQHELWTAYLEKAYATLYNGYDKIRGGHAIEAMVDLTGAFAVRSSLVKDKRLEAFNYLFENQDQLIMTTGINSKDDKEEFIIRSVGLNSSHAYTILSLVEFQDAKNETIRLVQIRNPHGKEAEFVGDWSDHSPLWWTVGPEIRKKLLVRKDDGAYYMSLKNWSDYFDNFSFGLLPEHEDKYKKLYFDVEKLRVVNGYFHDDHDTTLKFTLSVESAGYVWVQPFQDDENNRHDKFLLQLVLKDSKGRTNMPRFPANYKAASVSEYKKDAYLFYLMPGNYSITIKSYCQLVTNKLVHLTKKNRKWCLRAHGKDIDLTQ